MDPNEVVTVTAISVGPAEAAVGHGEVGSSAHEKHDAVDEISRFNFATVAVHAGSEPDARTGAVVPPISLATTFAQAGLGLPAGKEDPNSFGRGYEYSRTGNPTRGAFERAMAACERGKGAVAFASGLGAASAILTCLRAGDHVICIDDVYGGTQRLLRTVMGPLSNITTTFMDFSDPLKVAAAVTPKTALIWIETPTNPTLKVTDIQAIRTAVTRHDIWIVVDNTFFTPYLQQPLRLGASIVLHSCTKYIGGHSDCLMGCVVSDDMEIIQRLRHVQNSTGAGALKLLYFSLVPHFCLCKQFRVHLIVIWHCEG
jgi:cystathionine gamma-lyase